MTCITNHSRTTTTTIWMISVKIHTRMEHRPSSQSTRCKNSKDTTDYPDTKLFVSTTSSTKHFSEGKEYPYQSDNLDKTLQRRKSRLKQLDRGIKVQVQVQVNLYSRGDVVELNIGSTSASTGDDSTKPYLVNIWSRHLDTNSRGEETKHTIYLETVKDSLEDEYPSTSTVL